MNYEVIRVPPGSGPTIERIHRAAFPSRAIEFTLFESPRVWAYLNSLLDHPRLQRVHTFVGVSDGGQLIAYAHLRWMDDVLHLNNVAVVPEYRGRGIGTRLMSVLREEGARRQVRRITLDVDAENVQAASWYARHGFEEASRTHLVLRALERRRRPSSGTRTDETEILGWPAAEAWQAQFGFSSFEVRMGKELRAIGRLGERFFRVDGDTSPAMDAFLADLDPRRKLLVRRGGGPADGRGKLVRTVIRMQLECAS